MMIRFSDILNLNFKNQARFQTLGMTIGLCSFVFAHQVIFSGTPLWFTAPLIMAVFLVDLRWASFLGGLFLATILISYFLYYENGTEIPRLWTQDKWLTNTIIDQAFSLLFNLIILAYFYHSKKRAEGDLIKSQDVILKQQEIIFENSRMAELGQISGGVAHEINNPLAIILGNVHQGLREVKKGTPPDYQRIQRNFEKIQAQSHRIQNIIKSLLHFGQRSQDGHFQEVPLDELYEEIKEYYNDVIIKDGVELLFSKNDPNLKSLYCQHAQVFQAICHLINNSLDSIEKLETKRIEIFCEKGTDAIAIKIIDNGPGIPREIEHKVTSPFFSTKPIGKGSGLGLSVVEGIMKAHKGVLLIDRSSNDSRMVLRFPLLN